MVVAPGDSCEFAASEEESAKQLLAEYYTRMSNQGVSVEDAEALLAYLTAKDAE